MKKFPARIWNAVIDRLAAARPEPGSHCRIRWQPGGYCISADGLESLVAHPWLTTVRKDGKGNWLATIRPGFVNGIDPTVSVVDAALGKSVTKPLTELPEIVLSAFVDRSDPTSGVAIPAFFRELGASTDKTITYDSRTQSVSYGDNPKGWRRLKSCDLYLSIARVAVNGSIQINDATGTSGSVAQYVPVFDASHVNRYGSRPRVMQTGSLRAQQQLSASQRILDALTTGGSTDFPEDQLLIATVYLLSGPDDSPDDTAYVQHALFYNLGYAAQTLVNIKSPPAPITIFTGLAGGIGDTIANQILSSINDASTALASGLSSVTQEGKFWTL